MKEFVLFTSSDAPIGITCTKNPHPAASTIAEHGAAYAKPSRECTREQVEQAYRAQQDNRQYEGRRRRAGGHGYTGGDGFITTNLGGV